ncbi:HU family DNA-binding protein [Syntrophomonas palmitatica]|uniref:HU family DNA-binding protein n=1 Tax=Syntrophomonas palmitatica TaxID=402877 RepID=UPI0006CF8270|nr:HU family DNA-binding protein [Syntrophomonas palmitatica]
MNKSELIACIAEKTSYDQILVKNNIDVFLDIIQQELSKGGKVQITGFGTFESRQRKPKKGRNPQTGGELIIPFRIVPFFRPSKEFKEKIN